MKHTSSPLAIEAVRLASQKSAARLQSLSPLLWFPNVAAHTKVDCAKNSCNATFPLEQGFAYPFILARANDERGFPVLSRLPIRAFCSLEHLLHTVVAEGAWVSQDGDVRCCQN